MKRILAVVVIGVMISGCGISPEQRKLNEQLGAEAVRTIPVCTTGKDCDIKWDMAQLWISKNADMKIQTATNVIIETYNSVDSLKIAGKATKEPMGNNQYKIILSLYCGPYGCLDNPIGKVVEFNKYINGASQLGK